MTGLGELGMKEIYYLLIVPFKGLYRDYIGFYGGYIGTMEKENGNYYLGFRVIVSLK